MAVVRQGTPFDIDEIVRPDRVHRRVYTDPTIFDAEMRQIFERTWVFIGHDSEIPQPGDFKTCYLGQNPVIFTRDAEGQLRVLLNRCMHRGAVICREERGNTSAFRCGYHGWTYNSRGDLVLVPARGGYGPEFETEDLGLLQAVRVEAYRGFVFASLHPGVLPLDQHLGKAKLYLDLALDAAPDGEIEVPTGAQRYRFPANWKLQIENWTDHYHAHVVHESAFALRGRRAAATLSVRSAADDARENEGGWVTALPHGINTEKTRGGGGGRSILTTFDGRPLPGGDDYRHALVARRGENRTRELLDAEIQLMVFPNFFIQPRRQHFRVLRPIAVDRTEVWAYPYALKGAPADFNRKMMEDMSWWASAAGFGQPDDVEQFVRCQEGLQVASAEWVLINRGMHNEETLPDGEVRGESETTHRNIYREWTRLMSGAPAPGRPDE